jgi:Arc/MetJ-type ribon-helix-helix transcriptional regulator
MVVVMSTQIAVRLPDDLVEFVDRLVASGKAPSRAAVVTRALDGERRREAARRDARIYAESAEDDLGALAAWAAEQPTDID